MDRRTGRGWYLVRDSYRCRNSDRAIDAGTRTGYRTCSRLADDLTQHQPAIVADATPILQPTRAGHRGLVDHGGRRDHGADRCRAALMCSLTLVLPQEINHGSLVSGKQQAGAFGLPLVGIDRIVIFTQQSFDPGTM